MSEISYTMNRIGNRCILNFVYHTLHEAETQKLCILRMLEDMILWNIGGMMLNVLEYDISQKGRTVYLLLVWQNDAQAERFIQNWRTLWNQY